MLHGWLSKAEVAEFEKVVAEKGLPMRIDLEHLAGAGSEGLRALHRHQEHGARLTGASPYIALLLERLAGEAEGEEVGQDK